MASLVAQIKNWWGSLFQPVSTPVNISAKINGKLIAVKGSKVSVDGVPYVPGVNGVSYFSQKSYISLTLEGVKIEVSKGRLLIDGVQYIPEGVL